MTEPTPKSMADKCRTMAAEAPNDERRAFWLQMAAHWDRNAPKRGEPQIAKLVAI
jgi:hypothetical protein